MSKSVLIWGCGSIGMRHARIATELGYTPFCISSQTSLPYAKFSSLKEITPTQHFCLVIIATPTALHREHLEALSTHNVGSILIEKPLFSRHEKNVQLHLPQSRLFVAYNLRFHPAIIRLKELIQDKKLITLQLHVGQYLPSWRPEQDYTQSYSAHKNQGGGVLRDLSHELDLACHLAGSWKRVTALGGKYSSLKITSDDSFTILSEHERCPQVNIHMDYLQSPARRFIVAIAENASYYVDLIQNTLQYKDNVEHFTVDRDTTYQLQLDNLFNHFASNVCSYSEGLDTVRYIEAAEKSVEERCWVNK